jgi:hypothetical protein
MNFQLPYDHKAEDEGYYEINEALKHSLQHHQFRAGGFLKQMLERGNYGPYSTFKEYVVGELRISEVTGP